MKKHKKKYIHFPAFETDNLLFKIDVQGRAALVVCTFGWAQRSLGAWLPAFPGRNLTICYARMKMEIRLILKNDSIEDLTELIHRAYTQLANLGLRYWATHQSIEDTKKRILKSECYLVFEKNIIVGTVTLNFPDKTYFHPWYDREDVTTFNQLAVDPHFQRQGIGSKLLDLIEQRAVEMGAKELSCDTASAAFHLIDMYKKRGYREVAKADWEITNYTSVILSKALKA